MDWSAQILYVQPRVLRSKCAKRDAYLYRSKRSVARAWTRARSPARTHSKFSSSPGWTCSTATWRNSAGLEAWMTTLPGSGPWSRPNQTTTRWWGPTARGVSVTRKALSGLAPPSRRSGLNDAPESLHGRNDVRDAEAEILVDDHDFALGDEFAVDHEINGLAGEFVEFDDRSGAEVQDVMHRHFGSAKLHGDVHRNIEEQIQIGRHLRRGRRFKGSEFHLLHGPRLGRRNGSGLRRVSGRRGLLTH